MLRKMFQKYSLNIAIATLVILVIATIVACVILGMNIGLILGGIAFVFLDGIGSLWEVLTYPTKKNIGNTLEREEKESFYKNTKDNPTIR